MDSVEVDETTCLIIPLPLHKLSLPSTDGDADNLAILVEAGSFNPPTYMHLFMFESGRDALSKQGYHVMGGYMSPANDGYRKQGLISADHRIRMCQLAAEESSFVMVDSWEALQSTYQRTLKVLARVEAGVQEFVRNLGKRRLPRVFLLCGADLLESLTIPGIWLPNNVETICKDYGLVCLHRGGKDLHGLIQNSNLLSQHSKNIIIVDNFESNISSTRVRESLAKHLPVDDMTPARVIDYIKRRSLYIVPETTN